MHEKGNIYFPEGIRVFPLYLSGVYDYAVPLFIKRIRCQTGDRIWHAAPFCSGLSPVILQRGQSFVYILAYHANGGYFDV